MEIGKVYFGKYKVLDHIGAGGTSNVYLAENINLGNRWAIKRSLKDESTINLLAEPNLLKDLDHHAIPKIIDFEEDEEAIYIIEEYIEGINLKAYKLDKDYIEEHIIVDWAMQLCDVLHYLHSRQPPIIFRDLKPENIVYTKEGKLKLIDFGIARLFKEDSVNDTIQMGTRGYAPPEQYGISQSDERTDIFSLGVTLYFLITGTNLSSPPYKIQPINHFNNKIPPLLETIILKCCETLPSKRYQKIEYLYNDLQLLNIGNEKKHIKTNLHKPHYKTKRDKNIAINKTLSIGIIGVSHGVGVTHTAIMLASYLSKSYRVAVIELNQSKDYEIIGIATKGDVVSTKKFFKYKKVMYYWDINYASFLSKYKEDYDIIILDIGTYETGCDIDEYIRADINLVIGHGIDWKLREITRFKALTREYDSSNRWQYCVPYMKKKFLKEIEANINNKVYTIPFNCNPFIPSTDVINEIKTIVKGIV